MAQAEYVTKSIRVPIPGVNANLCTSLVRHAEFVAALSGHSSQTIPLDGDVVDLEDFADQLDKVPNALSVYVIAILDWHIDTVVSDLASDMSGTIQHAAAGVAGRIA